MPSAVLRPTRWTRRGNPRSGWFAGGEDLWCYLPKRAGLSKVTRPSPKGGRNPFEASGLASCTAKPCRIPPQKLQSGRLRLTANRPYDGTASPHQDPSPALPFAGEGAKASAPARSAAEHRPTVMTGGYQSKGGLAAPIGPKTPPSP